MKSVVLSALVLAIAVPACGKGGAEVEVIAGAPAGDVTEVAGTVTATRAGQVRPLRVGDAVSGDDVIATAADGRVTIALRHNHVPWSLGPGASRRVADSAAWRAPEGANVADVTDTVSGAAGRHAERTAADTIATAGAPARAAVVPTEGEVAEKRFASREEPVGTKLESPPPPPPDPADGPADRPGGGRPDPTGGRAPVEVETRRVLQAHQVALARCHAEAPAARPSSAAGSWSRWR